MSQAKLRALQQWCKNLVEGYRDVKITNMTSSWRDGLAFCALIHRFRPDLINYDSLSKEAVYENNDLAFAVAEDLGVAALLEAKDMEDLPVPDRLSIITYVASLYNYFKDKEKLGGPGVQKCKTNVRIGVKRPQDSHPPAMSEPKRSAPSQEGKDRKTSPVPARRRSHVDDHCTVCKDKVYLLEKHIEDGKLYHRSCFRNSHMSPTNKVLANQPTKTEASTFTENTRVKNISLNSTADSLSKVDRSSSPAKTKSPGLKGRLYEKRKDQIQKVDERLRTEKQQEKELHVEKQREQELYDKRKNSSSALKNHLKQIDAQTSDSPRISPVNPLATYSSGSLASSKSSKEPSPLHISNNTEKPNEQQPSWTQTKLRKVSDGKPSKTSDITPLTSQQESKPRDSKSPSPDSPKLMMQVSSQKMVDRKFQATKSVTKTSTSLNSQAKEQQVFSGLLKSLTGIRQRQSTTSTSSGCESPTSLSPLPSPAFGTVPPSHFSLNTTSTSVPDSSVLKSSPPKSVPDLKTPVSLSNKKRNTTNVESAKNTALAKSTKGIAGDNHVKSSSPLRSLGQSKSELSKDVSKGMVPIAAPRVTQPPLPSTETDKTKKQPQSLLERIEQYSKVAPNLGKIAVEPSPDKETEGVNGKISNSQHFSKDIKDKTRVAQKEFSPLPASTKDGGKPKEAPLIQPETNLIRMPPAVIRTYRDKPTHSSSKTETAKVVKPSLTPSAYLSQSEKSSENSSSSQFLRKTPGRSQEKKGESKSMLTDMTQQSKTTMAPASSVGLTKLHSGHLHFDSKNNSKMLTPIISQCDKVNPVPKPRRQKIGLVPGTAKENKENPSETKVNNNIHKTCGTLSERQDTGDTSKTEWQLEAERRIAARKGKYKDPESTEVISSLAGNKCALNNYKNDEVDGNISNGQMKKIPVTQKWFSEDGNSISNSDYSLDFNNRNQVTPKKDFINSLDKIPKARLSSEEILKEVKDIDTKLTDLELRGRELEDTIRAATKEEEEEKFMVEWFQLINKKNDLVRRENDLIYMSQEHELEEEQTTIDNDLQYLLLKPYDKKTKRERMREEELIRKKIAIVNQRNLIVDTIDENRLRYQEEDQGIQQMLLKKGLLEND